MADPKGVLVVPVAFRSDGSLHALELDSSDRLKVLIETATGSMIVTQSIPDNLRVSPWGYDGSDLQRLLVDSNHSLKVTEVVRKTARGSVIGDDVSNTALAAGTNIINAITVPANHTYILKNFSAIYVGTVATVQLNINIIISSVVYNLCTFNPVVSGVAQDRQCDIPLQAGTNVRLVVLNATLNDDAFLRTVYEDLS